jgi:hypothetical protein
MAGVLFLRDPDPVRLRRGLEAATAALRRMDLEVSSLEHGPIGIAWGSFAGAPVQHAPGVFVMGEVIPGPGPERCSAQSYAERCAGYDVPPPFDGLHVAATFDEHGAIRVVADLLGNFPIYTAALSERLFIATSPALITSQDGVRAGLDIHGLVGLLLTNGSLRGRTLYQGIRRLAAGHAVVAAPGQPPREVGQYAIPINDESHDVPIEESARRMHEALVGATKRHVTADVPHTMMLSGGLDSRLLTGVMVGQGITVEAITRGDPTDLEYRCARGVARHLGIPHRLVPHASGSFDRFERSLGWDGMSCAPGGGSEGLGETLRYARPHIVSGYLADSIMGAPFARKSFDPESQRSSAERYVARNNVWGVPLEILPRLLRKDVFADSLEVVHKELCDDFMSAGDTFMMRSWLFDLSHRQRYVMGRMFPRMAFGSWPRAPQLDREVLRVTAGIPLPVFAAKRLEREILERFYTGLARVPLDRNDPDTTPLLPSAMDLIRAGIDRRVRRVRQQIGLPRPERRYYHRTFDFNGAAWRHTRLAAAPDRERLYELFDRATLDAFLPAPDAHWQPTGLIEGASGVKMLTALGVWLRITSAT